MSLALFRSELRSAVRAVQSDEDEGTGEPRKEVRPASPQVDLLRAVARGELSVEAALCALGEPS